MYKALKVKVASLNRMRHSIGSQSTNSINVIVHVPTVNCAPAKIYLDFRLTLLCFFLLIIIHSRQITEILAVS